MTSAPVPGDVPARPPSPPPRPAAQETSLSAGEMALYMDHRVHGIALLPGAACLALGLAAARRAVGGPAVLREARFDSAAVLDPGRPLGLRVVVEPGAGGAGRVVVESDRPGAPARYMSAAFCAAGPFAGPPIDVQGCAERLGAERAGREMYFRLAEAGNDYGPAFRRVSRVWGAGAERLASIAEVRGAGRAEGALDVISVDAALHALGEACAAEAGRRAFVLAGIDHVSLPDGGSPRWTQVVAASAPDGAPGGEVRLLDAEGRQVGRLAGVRLAWVDAPDPRPVATDAPRAQTLAVAATFTAEPLDEVVAFWAETLGLRLATSHAPFGQVFQQLLDPASLLRRNRTGANVLLLRLEDWAAGPAGERRDEAALDGLPTRRLPNGLRVAHLNEYETDYLYQEIFADRVYLRHGITVGPGDCVFDVGANIGLFSLFARERAPGVRVLAFEPSPRLRPLLEANARAAGGIEVHPCGVSDRDGTAVLTFYPRSSVFSGYAADQRADEAALRAVIGNVLQRAGVADEAARAAAVEHFLAGRLEGQTVETPVRTLSSVIDERGLERVDLLKIDAERSERAVLDGLRPEHWAKVRQVVLEVHDRHGDDLRGIVTLLRERGFEVAQETEDLLGGSGLHTVYARRPEEAAPASTPAPANPEALETAVEDFLRALAAAAEEEPLPTTLVLTPASPAATASPSGRERLERCERRIAEAARAMPGVEVVLAPEVQALYPTADVHDERALELGGIPYTPRYFAALGTTLVRRLLVRRAAPLKAVAVDADDTLWSGVVGEVGPAGVVVDEEREQLQRILVEQARAGRLLFLCSKNEEADVRAVLREHPAMVLREEHVADWRVSWQAKSQALRSLASEHGLGLDAVLLLDDNPVECAEVAAHAPGVAAFRLPREGTGLGRLVRHLWLLDTGPLTEEDRRRAARVQDESRRARARAEAPTFEAFLRSLDLRCEFAPLQAADVERVAQLTQRTNQLNLARRPRDGAEIAALARQPGFAWRTVRVADRFGDYGLVGVLGFTAAGNTLRVDTFLLSCRALGRGVEQRMLHELGREADERGAAEIELAYVPAPRSRPMRDFLESIEPAERHEGLYRVSASAARAQAARPALARQEAAPPLPAAENGSAGAAQAPELPDPRRDPQTALRIATELATAEQIEAAILARRRALRTAIPPAAEPEGARDPLRAALSAVWAEVLGLAGVRVDQDFFDLGGTSLLLVQAASRTSRLTGTDIPIEQGFRLRTVDALARWLEGPGASRLPDLGAPARPAGPEGPVSHAQQALLYLHQLAPASPAYNIPFAALCSRELDGPALARAFGRLQARHQALRTVYEIRGGRMAGRPLAQPAAGYDERDARAMTAGELREAMAAEACRPFDLRRGPVNRLVSYRRREGAALLWAAHHVAVDLWSVELALSDLFRFYGEELGGAPRPEPAPAPSAADFARWEDDLLGGPDADRLWEFWRHELDGAPAALGIPLKRPPEGGRRFAGSSHTFRLPPGLASGLRALARAERATLFQVLLTAYAVLLQRHAGQPEVVIGSPFAVRGAAGFADTVGDLVNLLPLRVRLSGRMGFRDALAGVAETVMRVAAHQAFPFPLLVKKLGLKPEPGRLPLVQTTFALHEPRLLPGLGAFFVPGMTKGGLAFRDLHLSPVGITQQEGQFDLALEVVPVGDALWATFKLDDDLVDRQIVESLAGRFEALLADVVRRPGAALGALAFEGRPRQGEVP